MTPTTTMTTVDTRPALIVAFRRHAAAAHKIRQSMRQLEDALDVALEARADAEAELAGQLVEHGPCEYDGRLYEGWEVMPGLREVVVVPLEDPNGGVGV